MEKLKPLGTAVGNLKGFNHYRQRYGVFQIISRNTLWSSNCISRCTPKRSESRVWKRHFHIRIHSNIIHHSQMVVTTHVSTDSWIHTENVVYTCNGILFNLTKGGNSNICYNLEDSVLSEISFSQEEKTPYDFIHMRGLPKGDEKIMQGQRGGITDTAAACNADIPYGRWFVFWLLYFRSSSLWMAWASSRRWPNCLGPCHLGGRPRWSFWFLAMAWLSPSLLRPSVHWTCGWKTSVFFSLFLSVTLTLNIK